ncbi:MAG TPA: Rieske 2Fe-2S domain-containing protein [Mycobacterium sp.]|nr:Rieske 2Fe-2S domain-containing protein [Mycobacterium sp.]
MAATRRALPPYPSGWYALAFSDELARERLLVRPFVGRELVLLRARSGRVAAMEAYCPHLGAHFGHGGTVQGELLRCPFHGFRFDHDGRCVETGYASKPPPTACIETWPVREVNGMLLVYHGATRAAPPWEVPALDWNGWSAPVYRRFVLEAHPQETTENSVDLGHFSYVHGYRSVRMLRDVVVHGPYLSTAYTARRPAPLVGRLSAALEVDFEFETHIYGLGYSQVDVRIRGFDVRARLWVLPVPIDAERVALFLAASGNGSPDEVHPWLRPIPRRLRAALIGRGLLAGLVSDARQDFAIWQHKRYVNPPALAHGDGPIGKYRTWAKGFYD